MRVAFSSEANTDLVATLDYFDEVSPSAGERFCSELDILIRLLAEFPYLGAPAVGGTRRLQILGFDQALVYQVVADLIWIVAIEQQRRRPGYWGDRL